jgi:hypothetical protein
MRHAACGTYLFHKFIKVVRIILLPICNHVFAMKVFPSQKVVEFDHNRRHAISSQKSLLVTKITSSQILVVKNTLFFFCNAYAFTREVTITSFSCIVCGG